MNRKRLRPADELIDLAAVLVFVQGMVALVATVEIGIVTAAMGGLTMAAFVLTGLATVVTLVLPRGLRRRSRRARKTVVVLQSLWLVSAAIDLLLAIFLARRGLEPVPTITRIVIPIAVFRILRRAQVRAAFGVKPSRRDRRQMPPATPQPEPAAMTGALP
jgi:hypothetical protein